MGVYNLVITVRFTFRDNFGRTQTVFEATEAFSYIDHRIETTFDHRVIYVALPPFQGFDYEEQDGEVWQ